MEDIYVNVKDVKRVGPTPSTTHMGARRSERSFHLGVIVSLGLLSVLLLAGLIALGVHYRGSVCVSAAELSSIKDNLTERLQICDNNLTEMTKELDRLQSLSKLQKTCPAGWRMFNSTCYLLSEKSGSWDEGGEDCRNRGAGLVVIDSSDEQTFVSEFINKSIWIGLNDREEEGTWKWIDGTPLTLTYWRSRQPDNGNGDPQWGEEDCAQISAEDRSWNDISCTASMQWVCEKIL